METADVKAANKELQKSLIKQLKDYMVDTGHVPEINIYMNEYGEDEDMVFIPEVTVTSYVK